MHTCLHTHVHRHIIITLPSFFSNNLFNICFLFVYKTCEFPEPLNFGHVLPLCPPVTRMLYDSQQTGLIATQWFTPDSTLSLEFWITTPAPPSRAVCRAENEQWVIREET